ncbi:prolyl oligopeptidase family serine peptidase [Alkalihalophilus lindianensis]|uniref:Prolyl oligopeptidase family serine peptidase n=1 Tax=Alkalihalophilus lindianensis TaxID=1630542 RepID=A0ABU3XEP2_9BACI|nr:prolyl oligopeptidase family serine peptidase [Alkalihalophilus lindianensis]MDV2686365.1 prolyl oligopeptidase family serine peptidase [Alkalihalophilus lindianensis]
MQNRMIHKQKIPSPHPAIELFLITYWSEGLKVKGYLAEPVSSHPLPGLVYLRGGIKNVGMVRIQRLIQWASEGFVVIAPFYRGNKGGEGQEDFAGRDREDANTACEILLQHPSVNPKSVHVLGFSRGGVMALLVALKHKEVASLISWNGVTDMFLTYEERVDLRRMMKRVIGGTPNKYPDRYRFRTPLDQLCSIQSSVLIIHGAKDQHVSIEHAYRLERALLEQSKHVDTWYYSTYDHHFPPKRQQQILQQAAQWMKQQVKE